MMLRHENHEIGLPFERLHVMGYRRRPGKASWPRAGVPSGRSAGRAIFRRIKLGPAGLGTEDPARGR